MTYSSYNENYKKVKREECNWHLESSSTWQWTWAFFSLSLFRICQFLHWAGFTLILYSTACTHSTWLTSLYTAITVATAASAYTTTRMRRDIIVDSYLSHSLARIFLCVILFAIGFLSIYNVLVCWKRLFFYGTSCTFITLFSFLNIIFLLEESAFIFFTKTLDFILTVQYIFFFCK